MVMTAGTDSECGAAAGPAARAVRPQAGAAGRVLVLGASGRLGSLCRAAWGDGPPAIWQARRPVGGAARFDLLAAADRPAFRAVAERADVILGLAGPAGPGERPDLHADLARAILETARESGVRHVFLASSAAVYGDPGAHPVPEDARCAPVSDYGRAKLAMEAAARRWLAAAPSPRPGVTCLRIGNVAGADQLLGRPATAAPVALDMIPGHGAPRRSYLGPSLLTALLQRLVARARQGGAMPFRLNLAADGAPGMDALLDAAGRAWRPVKPAGPVIATVHLDITRLQGLCGPVPAADPAAIVADLALIRRAAEEPR
ncbi:NAD-dependent epimerase/dehydratase family protein [Albidovulum sp.]